MMKTNMNIVRITLQIVVMIREMKEKKIHTFYIIVLLLKKNYNSSIQRNTYNNMCYYCLYQIRA